MTEYTVVAGVINLAYLVATLALLRGLLWWFDRGLGISFKKDVWDVLQKNPVALAQYHGARLIAVCILAAAFLR